MAVQQGRCGRSSESVPVRYGEPLNDARTQLGGLLHILQEDYGVRSRFGTV